MPRIELLDPARNGQSAERLENKLRHLIIGQDGAIQRALDGATWIGMAGVEGKNLLP